MFKLIGMGYRIVLAFARSRISLMGVRRFSVEVASLYAVDELVDVTAEYNDWVKENEGSIKLALSLGLLARNTGIGLLERRGILSKSSVLFSQLKLVGDPYLWMPLLKRLSVKATSTGFVISEGGKALFELGTQAGKLRLFNHSGALGGALVAAVLGGAVPRTKEEWEATGQQFALQLANVAFTASQFELRSALEGLSPVTLSRNPGLYVDNFLKDHPFFPAEEAVAVCQDVLARPARRTGPWSLDCFETQEGIEVIRINGLTYSPTEMGDSMILRPMAADAFFFKEGNDKLRELTSSLLAVLGKVHDDGGISLIRAGKTSRYLSTPFIMGDLAIIIATSEESGGLIQFVYANESFFDSAVDNIEDEFNESSYEVVARLAGTLFSWGKSEDEQADDQAEIEEEGKSMELLIAEAKASSDTATNYRTKVFYLGSDDLVEFMGKPRPQE